MKPSLIKHEMNRLAGERKPFLFAIDFEMTDGFVVENPLQQHHILFKTPLASNVKEISAIPLARKRAEDSCIATKGMEEKSVDVTPMLQENRGQKSFFAVHPESFERYNQRFQIIMEGLMRGDSFLTNLTVKTPIETSLTLREIFDRSAAPFCLYFPERFVCFSPERFVRIKEGIISTNPMKGTIDASIPDAERQILEDAKETAEHNTVVDLMRNDLGMVAEDVRIARFRYIDYLKTKQRDILQVSSEITGRLTGDYWARLGDILFALLPAGSISGAPKKATVARIQQAEEQPRGFYTGIFGYFDGNEFDTAVMIRFIEEENHQKYFRSGGGITVSSEAHYEYNEVLEKIYLPFV